MSHEYSDAASAAEHEQTSRGDLTPAISRRGFFTLAYQLAIGYAIGSALGGKEGIAFVPPETLSVDENDVIIIPVILSSEEAEERGESILTKEEIIRHLGRDALALSRSTSGAVSLAIADPTEKITRPEGVHDDSQKYHYTEDQLKEMATAERLPYATGAPRVAVIFIDNNPNADLYVEGAAGLANQDSKLPMAIVPAWCIGAFLHELGHLLNPDEEHFGEGLNHQPVFTAKQWYIDEDGVNTMRIEMGTIQELIEKGCNLANDGNPYASIYTIMARRPSPDGRGEYRPGPLFSPPELAFLDAENRKVMTIPPTPGYYELSYTSGELFGVELELPEDHALRKIIPNADKIFFGPVVEDGERSKVSEEDYLEGDSDCVPFDSAQYTRKVVAFTRSYDGRSTTALEINILPNENGERVLYADEELDIVAVTGPSLHEGTLSKGVLNRTTEYVEIIQLSSPRGQQVLEEARREAEKRNEALATRSENN